MKSGTHWTKTELELLQQVFCSNETKDILYLFPGRTYKSISKQASLLKIKKTKELKSYLIGRRNKMVSRDLSFENLKKIALQYNSKTEFRTKDPSAYANARIKNWLEEICTHMFITNFSMPQMILKDILCQLLLTEIEYNNRKIIKPFELDIYIPKYKLAFEYNGKRWHMNDTYEKINNKNKLCKNLNIELIVIIENNRKYENDIKNQLIDNIDLINKLTNNTFKKDDILNIKIRDIFDSILDKNKINEICARYDDYSTFRKKETSLYCKLHKLNKLEEFTSHMKHSYVCWTEELIIKELSKYTYLYEAIENSFGCYCYCKRYKLNHLLSHLKYKDRSLIHKGKIISPETRRKISNTLKGNKNACRNKNNI